MPSWQYIPNAISIARIGATPFLFAALWMQNAVHFRWILLACLLSDILDGWIARTFNLITRLGSSLDSIADIMVQILMIFGLWRFHRETVLSQRVLLAVIVSLYFAVIIIALLRYGRVSSFHTVLTRVAAYAQGMFFISLFFHGFIGWVFYGAVSLCILASIEELAILSLLPEWTPDVRGIRRVLAARGTTSP